MATSLELAAVLAEALGLPQATVVQHLRNLQKRRDIVFKGYGRGAARMGTSDAARLLIAAVGSDQVKDSLTTVDSFGSLLPVSIEGRGPPRQLTFLEHVTALFAGIAAAAEGGARPPPERTNIAFRVMSAAGAEPNRHPRFAISKTSHAMNGAITFGPADWRKPVLGESDFAMQLRGSGSGLIRIRIVTIDAMHAIAAAL